MGVSPFGHPRIEARLQLPEAFRSLPRPSSAPIAQAFALRPFLLDLLHTLAGMLSRTRICSNQKLSVYCILPQFRQILMAFSCLY
jgi:hypothetical protein